MFSFIRNKNAIFPIQKNRIHELYNSPGSVFYSLCTQYFYLLFICVAFFYVYLIMISNIHEIVQCLKILPIKLSSLKICILCILTFYRSEIISPPSLYVVEHCSNIMFKVTIISHGDSFTKNIAIIFFQTEIFN